MIGEICLLGFSVDDDSAAITNHVGYIEFPVKTVAAASKPGAT
jgi:hypothetical protein